MYMSPTVVTESPWIGPPANQPLPMLSVPVSRTCLLPASYPMENWPFMPGRVLDFLISNRPLYQKPPRSFLMLTVDLPVISGEPGPIAPAGNFESHFQLPSKFLANAVSSGAGVG